MATFYSDIGTDQNDSVNQEKGIHERALGHKVSGELQVATPVYTVSAAENIAATDVINLVKIPDGAVVIPELCFVSTDGVGATTCTIDFGDETDPNRYATAIDVNSAGSNISLHDTNLTAYYAAKDGGEWVSITIAALTGAETAGRILRFVIAWKCPSE